MARLGQVTFGIKAELRQVRKELADLKGKLSKTARSTAGLTDNLRNLQSASVLAVGPLSGIGARITALGTITNRSTIALAAMVGAITLVGVALAKLSSTSVQASLAIEKIMAGLIFATGSVKAAKEEFQFLADTSLRLGVDLASSATEYAKLAAAAKGSKLEGEETRKVFVAISEAAVGLRLSNDQVAGAFRALQQMMSKGSVQSEEIRGQFGERIPGAFKLAARAMGVTTKQLGKMLEQGQILTDDFMPKFSRVIHEAFEQSAVGASKSLQASLNRLSTTWLLLRQNIDETLGLTDSFQGAVDGLIGGLNALNRNLKQTALIAGTVGTTLAVFAISPAIVKGMGLLVVGIKRIALALIGLASVATAATTGVAGTLLLLARFTAAIGAGAVAMHLLEKALNKVPEEADDLSDSIKDLVKAQDDLGSATGKSAKRVNALLEELRDLSNLTQQMAMQPGLFRMNEALQKSLKLIRDMSPLEMDQVTKALSDMGFEGQTLEEQIAKLMVAITGLKTNLKDMTKAPTSAIRDAAIAFQDLEMSIPEEGVKKMRDAFKDSIKVIDALRGELGEFERQVARIESLELFGFLSAEDAAERIKQLSDALFGIPLSARDAALAMAEVEFAMSDADSGLAKYIEELDRQIKALRGQAVATDAGTQALEKFQRQLARDEAIREGTEALRNLGASEAEAAAKMRELAEATDIANHAAVEATKKFTVQAVSFQDLSNTISAGMAEWVVKGKEFDLVLKDIIDSLARMAIQALINNNIMSAFGFLPAPGTTGLPSSPLGSGGGGPIAGGVGGGSVGSIGGPSLNRAALTTPIQALSGGGGGTRSRGGNNITINVNAPNSTPGQEFRIAQAIRNMGDVTHRRTLKAVAQSRTRGRST